MCTRYSNTCVLNNYISSQNTANTKCTPYLAGPGVIPVAAAVEKVCVFTLKSPTSVALYSGMITRVPIAAAPKYL